MQLTGFHHLTAITADAPANFRFYARMLGLRLVKRTVNQDDVSAYHLFYADGLASPGSDITFFDWPLSRERRGTGSIVRTDLRVAGHDSLGWWADWLDRHGVAHRALGERDGRAILDFEDTEGQRLTLVADPGLSPPHPWEASPVPAEHQIRGLGAITISVPQIEATDRVLQDVLQLTKVRTYAAGSGASEAHVYAMGEGGETARELHVLVEPDAPAARQGAGGAHHLALRTPNETTYNEWAERLRSFRMPSSGPVDRYYFRSLYFREPNGILIEIATDGPGFAVDEPLESLGQTLALPPFLEPRRAEIEAGLKFLET